MKWRGKLINNEQIVDIDVLKKQITNHGGLCYGRVVNVVGLGGGNTFGLGEYVYLTHYADDANGSDTPYHELAHCLGYGHSGNMTYYPAEGGSLQLYEGLLTAFREQEITGLFPPFLAYPEE